MSVEGAAAGKRLHLFCGILSFWTQWRIWKALVDVYRSFALLRMTLGILRETYFLFYIFCIFYLPINERFVRLYILSSFFYKFLHSSFSCSIFYKRGFFLRMQKLEIPLNAWNRACLGLVEIVENVFVKKYVAFKMEEKRYRQYEKEIKVIFLCINRWLWANF